MVLVIMNQLTNQIAYFKLFKCTWLKLPSCQLTDSCYQLGQVHVHFHLVHADDANGVQVVFVVAQRDILELFSIK